jgi:cobalt/nickel transport protein
MSVRRRRTAWFIIGGLFISLLLADVVSNFASGDPDGLDSATLEGCTVDETGAITGGTCIAQRTGDHELGDSPLADYGVLGIGDGFLSTGLAGVAGVLITFAAGGALFWLVRRRSPPDHDQSGATPARADRG